MSSAPYLRMYVRDWLGDPNVAGLDYELQGVYISILFRMWQSPSCSLPNDDSWLSRMLGVHTNKWAKWRKVLIEGPAPVLFAKDGIIFNPRLTHEFQRMADRSEKSSMAIKTRWDRFHSEGGEVGGKNGVDVAKKTAKKKRKETGATTQSALNLGAPAEEDSKLRKEEQAPFVSLILAGNTRYDVFETDMLSFAQFYPGIDLKTEFRRMAAWTMTNPRLRKTRGGTPKFINNWLSKAQNEMAAKTSSRHQASYSSGSSVSGFGSQRLQERDYSIPEPRQESILARVIRQKEEEEVATREGGSIETNNLVTEVIGERL